MSCHGTVAQTLLWGFLCAQLGHELSVMLVFAGSSGHTQKIAFTVAGEALMFSISLCLLEALETALPLLDTYDCLLFRLVSKAVEIIRYCLPSNLGISGLPRWAGGEKPAFVCQEFGLPESTHGQKLSDFLSALVKQTREQKGKVEWHCHKLRFAVSGAVLVVYLEIMKLPLCFYLNPVGLHFEQNSWSGAH